MSARAKSGRHRRIVQLLRREAVASQAELLRLLRDEGEVVTQATLSRDLEELGAFKVRGSDGHVTYRLPEEPPANGAWLERMLHEFVVEIESSGSLVVARTPPGGAGPVARAIDSHRMPDVLGTIAGDDTILLICRQGVSGRSVARRLRALAGQFTDLKEAQ